MVMCKRSPPGDGPLGGNGVSRSNAEGVTGKNRRTAPAPKPLHAAGGAPRTPSGRIEEASLMKDRAEPADAAAVLDSVEAPIVVYDLELRFACAKEAFCRSVHRD